MTALGRIAARTGEERCWAVHADTGMQCALRLADEHDATTDSEDALYKTLHHQAVDDDGVEIRWTDEVGRRRKTWKEIAAEERDRITTVREHAHDPDDICPVVGCEIEAQKATGI